MLNFFIKYLLQESQVYLVVLQNTPFIKDVLVSVSPFVLKIS